MFTAILVACHAYTNVGCFMLTDDRGPYKTMEQCEERIDEMLANTIKVWLDHKAPLVVTGWNCKRDVPET